MKEKDSLYNMLPSTPEQILLWFICILVAFTFVFIIWKLWFFRKAYSSISWLEKLLKKKDESVKIADLVPDWKNVAKQRNKTKKSDVISHLWIEFNESLVESKKSDGSISYCNTLDASHFFNSSTLARPLTESRLMATVPGILTAIGVIGTFWGLQIGLSGLNFKSLENIQQGVQQIVDGAKFAFSTSLLGISLSLVFSIYEKSLDFWICSRVDKLQNLIDKIFPRINAEAQLQSIVESSDESKKSLQGLAEQIGEKMQESLTSASEVIKGSLESSLTKIMAPAINKLVDKTSEGNQDALEDLLEKFMDKFGDLGSQQSESIKGASDKVNDALNKMGETMYDFIKEIRVFQSESKNADENRNIQIETLGSTTLELVQNIGESIDRYEVVSKGILNQGIELQKNFQKSTANIDSSAREFKSATEKISVFSSHIKEAVEDLKSLVEKNRFNLEKMDDIRENFKKDFDGFNSITDKMQIMIEKVDGTFNGLQSTQSSFLDDLEKKVHDLSEHMTELLKDYSSQANAQTKEHLEVWARGTTNYAEQMNRGSDISVKCCR